MKLPDRIPCPSSRTLLALALTLVALAAPDALAQRKSDRGELLRRSHDENPLDADPRSTPGGPVGKAPLATGYYVVDNDDPLVGAPWRPSYVFLDTTGIDSRRWRRIRPGPNLDAPGTWEGPGSQGKEFFRNPHAPADSTDDAIAGPIAIGFPFHYYGRAYDSFYVSTNGLIALSNRRYDYDSLGRRIDYNRWRDDTLARPRIGASAALDPTPDDYGWRYVALGNSSSPTGGLRNPSNGPLPDASLRAAIAPLWTDQELSQYDPVTGRVDDFGRVYWRRDDSGNRLIIYFVNISMKGPVWVPLFNVGLEAPRREMRANVQVILDRTDSSVQFNYVRFLGAYFETVNRSPWVSSSEIHRVNSTIGLQSNPDAPAPCTVGSCPGATGAEHTTYSYNDHPVTGGRMLVNGDSYAPHSGLAINFRQWANKARVLGVTLRVPSRIDTSFVGLAAGASEYHELLLGHPLLGVIRPVGYLQNVSDSIGPVNRTPQPVRFETRMRIRDLVNCTAPPVYESVRTSDPLHPIRVAAAGSPSIDTIEFDAFTSSAQVAAHAGRFRVEMSATGRGVTGQSLGERWPFDDTSGVRVFGLVTRPIPWVTTFNDFSVSCLDGLLPNTRQWVSIGPRVVDGDRETHSPPPPRGPATGSDGRTTLNSPVLLMDRRSLADAIYEPRSASLGDTLVSFPVDISTARRPVVILSYERAGRMTYDRGWSDLTRIGPEHAAYNVLKTGFLQVPDRLVVEFAEPSPNGIDNITNVRSWSDRSFGDTTGSLRWSALTGRATSPRWGVFGGGGGSGSDTTGRVTVLELDAGKDFRFNRAVIPIPARWSGDPNTNRTFRFRVMVEATDHGDPIAPADDDDPFFVDNIGVTSLDRPELEITAVAARWPYTIAPATQARAIPLVATVANNGSASSTAFGVALSVRSLSTPPGPGLFSYYRFRSVISLGAGQERTESFPTWNAHECGAWLADSLPFHYQTRQYRIAAQILPVGLDANPDNDRTHEDFTLTLGSVFAYDDSSRVSGRNDVPWFSGTAGKGLTLAPSAEDGLGLQPYGPPGGNASGTFAMRFTVVARDTVRGFQAYFGSHSMQPERIQYALYRASPWQSSSPPDTPIRATRVLARRGEGTPLSAQNGVAEFTFDTYVTWMLPTPYVIEPGEYYATVSQLDDSGIELGGAARNQGQVTTIVDTSASSPGLRNVSPPAHAEMHDARFWFETGVESSRWSAMIQPTTNPGFPHLDHRGSTHAPSESGHVPTYTRGSWIPMIRPYFGPRSSSACVVTPVELTELTLTPLATALRLAWTTASELDNRGFHIERRARDRDAIWSAIAFVQGAGTSNRAQRYAYTDVDVAPETTYQYRLRQEDIDGAVTYSEIREGRLGGATTGSTASRLEQNVPNPFSETTRISYAVAGGGRGTLEIIDVHGRLVRRFEVDGNAALEWDGTGSDGTPVAEGVYFYRLSVDGFTAVRKLSVVR
ncbi:MAG TPA: T9SS type A sorting domain-containing protein [Candidatus Kapabacteria bacterium]|nr:T9SS type A sorting domain-containing protein [Candidatus Kapabacteria bacterium]